MTEKPQNEDVWRSIFETGNPQLHGLRKHYDWWPAWPSYARCRLCLLPFSGIGGVWMRRVHNWGPSGRNRHYCNKCDDFINNNPGGAKVEMSVLFVDIRNSSRIAEKLDPALFAKIIRRFTKIVAKTLTDEDGFIFKFSGDALGTVYPPGFLGPVEHARRAIAGAESLLRTAMPRAPGGGELSIGIGVHTGLTYIGTLNEDEKGQDPSSEKVHEKVYDDVQPIGDVPNVSAGLSAMGQNQAFISESTLIAAGYNSKGLKLEDVYVKSRVAPVPICKVTRQTPPLREQFGPNQ